MDEHRIPSTEERFVGFLMADATNGTAALSKAQELGFTPEWIEDATLKRVAETVIQRHGRGEPIDASTLMDATSGEVRSAVLLAFEGAAISLPHALAAVKAIAERRRRKAATEAADRFKDKVASGNWDVGAAIEDLKGELQKCERSGGALADSGIVLRDWNDMVKDEPPVFDWIVKDIIAKSMKGDLIGKSKQMKSFLGQQLAHCVACGIPFLGLEVPRPRRVAYFDLELPERALWERGTEIDRALGAKPAEGCLYEATLRGRAGTLRANVAAVKAEVARLGIDLVILDPRYKLIGDGEDENTAAGLRGVLQFRDSLAEVAAVLMVGHDPKGSTEGKSIADRGAGSYTAGADYDFSFAISPHETDGYSVLSASSRCRKSPPDLSIEFLPERGVFVARPEIPARVKKATAGGVRTSSTAGNGAEVAAKVATCAAAYLQSHGATPRTQFLEELPRSPGFPEVSARDFRSIVDGLIKAGTLAETRGEGRGGVKLITFSENVQ